MIFHLDIRPSDGQPDTEAARVKNAAAALGISGVAVLRASHGYLVQGNLSFQELEQLGTTVFADPVTETASVAACAAGASKPASDCRHRLHVLPKPGVTDPVGESALALLRDRGHDVAHCRTIRTYEFEGTKAAIDRLVRGVLANDAVEMTLFDSIPFDRLDLGQPYHFARVEVPLAGLDEAELIDLSRRGQLSLNLDEMRAIQAHFNELGRDPSDCELETLAQTWSEHCSHKTLKGRVNVDGTVIDNLLKQTIFKATKDLGLDWLVSVFEDNAGVIRFDDDHDVCFKVETHNHPSAIDPYGGANTGLGGVIRDVLGTGLGAKPIANTDVFCVAPQDTPMSALPPGVIPPARVLEGVVAGVRDYGNRMGIPTVNGAVCEHPGYLANPLVFCGTVGVMPRGMAFKSVEPGDRIVAIGGRTGRDGIHGATFSSVELTSESDQTSGGAVQIGNAITEKMILDVLLQARDRGLYRAITDCGAGGFSSAVGEMGAEIGAWVALERAPLKYEGLSYTEIWISEAQERMVLAVPPEKWPALKALCDSEGVEATDLGQFENTGRLRLCYEGHVVCDLSMRFLHEGRPRVERTATVVRAMEVDFPPPTEIDYGAELLRVLAHGDVCSKAWIIHQYDHEVQGRTVIKPLVGPRHDGPGDAAVILPVRGSRRGLAVACGICARYGALDPYAMGCCAVDEAVRNCVAVGADPERIALLDNFCWGNPERPEILGALVEAARACHDMALAYGTPFISGKDSLYNEYLHDGRSTSIPPTLLISAVGIVPDVRRCVTMDLKEPGNVLALVGITGNHLGGSVWLDTRGDRRGRVPRLDHAKETRSLYQAMYRAMGEGLIRACHDISDGGLAAALAEMSIAGRLGVNAQLDQVASAPDVHDDFALLFSETPGRFVVEICPHDYSRLCALLPRASVCAIGSVAETKQTDPRLAIHGRSGNLLIDLSVSELKNAWARLLTT